MPHFHVYAISYDGIAVQRYGSAGQLSDKYDNRHPVEYGVEYFGDGYWMLPSGSTLRPGRLTMSDGVELSIKTVEAQGEIIMTPNLGNQSVSSIDPRERAFYTDPRYLQGEVMREDGESLDDSAIEAKFRRADQEDEKMPVDQEEKKNDPAMEQQLILEKILTSSDWTFAEKSVVKWQLRLHGDFNTALWKAIILADEDNLALLKRGFPEEIAGYMAWAWAIPYSLGKKLRKAGLYI